MTGLPSGLLQALLAAHIMAMITTALLAARAKLGSSIELVGIFAAGLAAGLIAVALGVGETPAHDVLLAAALLEGLAAAAALRLSRLAVGSAAFVVGLALGLDSPPDTTSLHEAIVALFGTWCAAVTLVGAALAVAAPLARLWNGIALRVVGSWLAATAMLVLAVRWAS